MTLSISLKTDQLHFQVQNISAILEDHLPPFWKMQEMIKTRFMA